MGERVERWKAREKVRSAVGWVAILMGCAGLSGVVGGIATWIERSFGRERTSWHARVLGFESPPEPDFGWGASYFAVGAVLLYCAYGLWNVRQWARRATIVLCLTLVALGMIPLFGEPSFECWLPLAAFAAIYLLLPTTGRHFARAAGNSEEAQPRL